MQEEAVVTIDYVTPEEVDTPETDTPDDTVDTTPEVKDPEGKGCDQTGTPDGFIAKFAAAALAVLARRRKKN